MAEPAKYIKSNVEKKSSKKDKNHVVFSSQVVPCRQITTEQSCNSSIQDAMSLKLDTNSSLPNKTKSKFSFPKQETKISRTSNK